MNRKERRNLRKDKDLVKELYSIICKYLPELLNMFNKPTDKRNQSYVTYQMKTICVTRLFSLLCGITSMTDISSARFNGCFQLLFDSTRLSSHNYNLNNNCKKKS